MNAIIATAKREAGCGVGISGLFEELNREDSELRRSCLTPPWRASASVEIQMSPPACWWGG